VHSTKSLFNILLAKRNKEKETFLNEKTSSFNKIYEKLNGSKEISDGIPLIPVHC
jgi:hypothetical protein